MKTLERMAVVIMIVVIAILVWSGLYIKDLETRNSELVSENERLAEVVEHHEKEMNDLTNFVERSTDTKCPTTDWVISTDLEQLWAFNVKIDFIKEFFD